MVHSVKINYKQLKSVTFGYDSNNKAIKYDYIAFSNSASTVNTPSEQRMADSLQVLANNWKNKALKLTSKYLNMNYGGEKNGALYIYDYASQSGDESSTGCHERDFDTFSNGGCNGKWITVYQDVVPEQSVSSQNAQTTPMYLKTDLYLYYYSNGTNIKSVKIPFKEQVSIKIDKKLYNTSTKTSSYDTIGFGTVGVTSAPTSRGR